MATTSIYVVLFSYSRIDPQTESSQSSWRELIRKNGATNAHRKYLDGRRHLFHRGAFGRLAAGSRGGNTGYVPGIKRIFEPSGGREADRAQPRGEVRQRPHFQSRQSDQGQSAGRRF